MHLPVIQIDDFAHSADEVPAIATHYLYLVQHGVSGEGELLEMGRHIRVWLMLGSFQPRLAGGAELFWTFA